MKIYIAGAISGTSNYRDRFNNAEMLLSQRGHAVINPVKNDGFSYKEYIDMGLHQLMQCEAVFLLRGWELSTGAQLEYHYAKSVGLKIIYDN